MSKRCLSFSGGSKKTTTETSTESIRRPQLKDGVMRDDPLLPGKRKSRVAVQVQFARITVERTADCGQENPLLNRG